MPAHPTAEMEIPSLHGIQADMFSVLLDQLHHNHHLALIVILTQGIKSMAKSRIILEQIQILKNVKRLQNITYNKYKQATYMQSVQ